MIDTLVTIHTRFFRPGTVSTHSTGANSNIFHLWYLGKNNFWLSFLIHSDTLCCPWSLLLVNIFPLAQPPRHLTVNLLPRRTRSAMQSSVSSLTWQQVRSASNNILLFGEGEVGGQTFTRGATTFPRGPRVSVQEVSRPEDLVLVGPSRHLGGQTSRNQPRGTLLDKHSTGQQCSTESIKCAQRKIYFYHVYLDYHQKQCV